MALACGDELLISRPFDQTRPRRDHVADLLPTVEAAMAELAWRPADIEQVHVSAGPGSFTGLRIAVSFAKAAALALGWRIVMVPTAEVLAANAPDDVANLAVVLDAKREQIYTAVFSRAAPGEPFREILPVAAIPPAEMLACAPRPLHLLGEGIDYHREALAVGGDVIELPRALWSPRAENVLRVGIKLAESGQFTTPEDATPIYVRRPEAEELWEKRHGVKDKAQG